MSSVVKIKNKKTGVVSTVDASEWEKIQQGRLRGKFEVVADVSGVTSNTVETDLASLDYESIMRKAGQARKDKNWERALELYNLAKDIKSTAFIDKRISELEKKISE